MSEEDRITLDGAAKAALALTRSRLMVISFAFMVGFAVLIARLTEVTILRDEVARAPSPASDNISLARVDVTDRNGEILAAAE